VIPSHGHAACARRARDRGTAYDTSNVRSITPLERYGVLRSRRTAHAHVAILIDTLGSTKRQHRSAVPIVTSARRRLTSRSRPIRGRHRRRTEVSHGKGEQGILHRTARMATSRTGKDRRTFILLDGESYVLTVTGRPLTRTLDQPTGRGSMSINSGERRSSPRSRRGGQASPVIDDCLSLHPDERFGQRVVAIVATVAPSPPKPEEINEFLRLCWRTTRSQRGGRARNVRRAPTARPITNGSRGCA